MGLPSRGQRCRRVSPRRETASLGASRLRGGRLDHLDIGPSPQVIIDGSAVRGKALDSRWNRRKCNPNRECRSRNGLEHGISFRSSRLAGHGLDENNAHVSITKTCDQVRQLSKLSFSPTVTTGALRFGCDKADGPVRISRVHAQGSARQINTQTAVSYYPDYVI
jgi:hypothetical protein